MVYLHITPAVSKIRAYREPNGYEKRLKYYAVMEITHLSDTLVFLSCAIGEVDRETREEAYALLRSKGVTHVQMERHGQMKTISLADPVEAT